MGGAESKSNQPVYHWQRVVNQNGVEIYRRTEDNTLAEKRAIFLDSTHSYETEHAIYNYRKDNQQGLVRVYEVEFLQESIQPKKKKQAMSDLCKCTENMNINVYSERIEYRLSELPQLTFAESIQFLKQTLFSFQTIYHKMGPLHINAELIGVNDLGEIKVWVNENWALNHPSHLIHSLKSTSVRTEDYDMVPPELRDESEMIKNLVTVIEDKTEQGSFPNDFGQQIRQKTSSFREARKFMNRFPTQESKSYMPGIIKRIRTTAKRNQSALFPNSLSIGSENRSHNIDLQSGNVKPMNSFATDPIGVGHKTTVTTNTISSKPINILINTPPLSTTTHHPLTNAIQTMHAPSTSISTINFSHSNHTAQPNHNPKANFYFGKEKQPTAVLPLDHTTHVHLDSHNYHSSISKSFLDTLPSYQPTTTSSPLTFKQFQPTFNNYTSTYKPYSSPPLYDSSITGGSQISKLFPDLKFSLLANNANYAPTSNQFPINNNVGVPQQVKSSLEAPASPLHSLDSMMNKDFGQEHQATYRINPQMDQSHGKIDSRPPTKLQA